MSKSVTPFELDKMADSRGGGSLFVETDSAIKDRRRNPATQTELENDKDFDIRPNFSSSTDGIDIFGESNDGNFARRIVMWSGRIMSDSRFKRIMIGLILIDSLLLGIGTFDFVTENVSVHEVFEILNTVFLAIFTVELIWRFWYHFMTADGLPEKNPSRWLILDVIVIAFSWIFSFAYLVVRSIRVVRTLRLATRWRPLQEVTLVLLHVLPRLMALCFVIFLSFYVFSILFCDLYKDLYGQNRTDMDYFSNLSLTAFTLFQIMTLDGWAAITQQVQEATNSWSWILFAGFVIASFIFIFTISIAIVFEAIQQVAEKKFTGIDSVDGSQKEKGKTYVDSLDGKVDRLIASMEILVKKREQG